MTFQPMTPAHYTFNGGNLTITNADKSISKTLSIPLTRAQWQRGWESWQISGNYVQDAFPTLNADQREFIMTGITPEEWEAMFGSEEEDEE